MSLAHLAGAVFGNIFKAILIAYFIQRLVVSGIIEIGTALCLRGLDQGMECVNIHHKK